MLQIATSLLQIATAITNCDNCYKLQQNTDYSLFTNCSFDPIKNKLDCYKGEDCMERFCKELRERAMKVINYEKKK